MKKFLPVLVLMFICSFIGCAAFDTVSNSGSPCVGLEKRESMICDIIANPQEIDFMLRIANAGALEADIYTARSAMATINKFISIVEDGNITYADLYRLIIKDVSPLIFTVVDEYSEKFAGLHAYLTKTDIGFILTHLKRQKVLVQMALDTAQSNAFFKQTIKTTTDDMQTNVADRSCKNSKGWYGWKELYNAICGSGVKASESTGNETLDLLPLKPSCKKWRCNHPEFPDSSMNWPTLKRTTKACYGPIRSQLLLAYGGDGP